jgi:hypothetical protein
MPVPPAVRIDLSGGLIDAGSVASKILSRVSTLVTPEAGTPASEWLDEGSWSTGMSSIMQAISTAIDHYRAFAKLLRASESYVPSLAALCRAFVEVAGRASWLMASTDLNQLEHKAAAMRLQEVRDAGQFGMSARVRAGRLERVERAEVVREAEKALSAAVVSGRKERVPDYSTFARNVMTAAGITTPKDKYSHLSAVTHGSGFIVGGLGSRRPHASPDLTSFAFELPLANAQLYLDVLTRVLNHVMTSFLSLVAGPSERARWTASYTRTSQRLRDSLASV